MDRTYQSSSAAVTLDCKLLSAILRSMIGMSGLALATMVRVSLCVGNAGLGERERGARLVGNVHSRTKVPCDEPDEPGPAAQLEEVQALEGVAAPGDVARQNLQ